MRARSATRPVAHPNRRAVRRSGGPVPADWRAADGRPAGSANTEHPFRLRAPASWIGPLSRCGLKGHLLWILAVITPDRYVQGHGAWNSASPTHCGERDHGRPRAQFGPTDFYLPARVLPGASGVAACCAGAPCRIAAYPSAGCGIRRALVRRLGRSASSCTAGAALTQPPSFWSAGCRSPRSICRGAEPSVETGRGRRRVCTAPLRGPPMPDRRAWPSTRIDPRIHTCSSTSQQNMTPTSCCSVAERMSRFRRGGRHPRAQQAALIEDCLPRLGGGSAASGPK